MSRIGRLPVVVPKGVDVTIDGRSVSVISLKNTLSLEVAEPIEVNLSDGVITVIRPNDEGKVRALHGLSRTLVANMVTGVTDGYSKTLEIVGFGYRVQAKGSGVEFSLGYSHPVPVTPPDGVTLRVETPTRLVVEGIDKQQVGEVAANIRKLRKPDPYKGKGVRTPASCPAARSGRLESRTWLSPRSEGAGRPAPARPRGRGAICACARRSPAARPGRGWPCTGPPGTSSPSWWTTARAARSYRRLPWKRTCAPRRATRRPGRIGWASCWPAAPRRRVSPPPSSTGVATPTTAGWPRWPTVPAKAGCRCDG